MTISLSNAHARASVLSAVWSPQDSQLVAVVLAATDKAVLTALKAELEKNNKNALVALAGDVKAELAGAKRGHVHVSATLEKVNAQGHVTALLHWRAHDPRIAGNVKAAKADSEFPPAENYFYVVARHGDCLPTLFLERLQLALAWPLKPEWAELLLTMGQDAELVEYLPIGLPQELEPICPQAHGFTFQAALRVVKCDDRWGTVISQALETHAVTF
jgi:hypothetical protein